MTEIGEQAVAAFEKWRSDRDRTKRILAAMEADVRDRTPEQAALCAVARLIGEGVFL